MRQTTHHCKHCGWHVEAPCLSDVSARGCMLYREVHYGVDAVAEATKQASEELGTLKEAIGGDAVTLPSHYTRFKIEPITFIMENGLNFQQGNIIKYVCRWDGKDGLQDLKKARRYLDMWIKKIEGDASWSK